MKHGWSDSSRFGQTLWFSVNEIDRLCVQELRKAGCLPEEPAPIDIERFVEKHYSRIEYLDLGEGVLGCTEFSKSGSVLRVIISSSLESGYSPSERRLRSTVAHEAGHCMMHSPLFIDDSLQATFQNENYCSREKFYAGTLISERIGKQRKPGMENGGSTRRIERSGVFSFPRGWLLWHSSLPF